MRRIEGLRWLLALSVLGVTTPAHAQTGTGTVEGRVVEVGTNRPLASAQVLVRGTAIGAATSNAGVFRITGVPPRQVEIQVRLLGYAPGARTVLVTAGQTTTADFTLQVRALQLEQVVITGSGQATEVKRLGNTVSVIQPPKDIPISDISSLLTAREPGLSAITSAGLTGSGSRIRIRGNASITQSNEPVFFVDGIRVNAGGGMTSRIDDIDPASIERVEVLKGAAAATLYGTEASNGVIQIFTKKGTTGAPRWSFSAQQEAIQFPDRIAPNAGYARTQAQADSLARFWQIPGLKAFQVFEVPLWNNYFTETGTGTTLTGQVDGGGNAITYFASGRYQGEDGPIGAESMGPARDNLRRIQTLANLSLVPFNSLRLHLRSGYYNTFNGIPGGGIIGNSIYGTYALTQYARPEVANCNRPGTKYVSPGVCDGPGNPIGNAAFMTARESMQQITEEQINRSNGAINAAYTPTSELSLDLTGGWDVINRNTFSFSRFRYDVDEYTQNNIEGSRSVGTQSTRVLTLDGKTSWNRTLTSALTSAFVAGVQVFNDRTVTSSGSSTNLPGPGIEVVGAGGANITVGEGFSTTINGGYFAQEQLGYRNWIFLTGGARYDFASAFGRDAPGVTYPKLSLSVVPSDLTSWSAPLGVNTLRVRAAWGRSGRQPGAFDKFTTFSPLRGELGAGLVPSQLGNQALKPEITTELEGGFEAGMWDDRVGLNFTAWKRRVTDLLVSQQFPVSGGFRQAQIANIGEIAANGYEFGIRTFAISAPNLQVELNANAAWMKQTVVSLGGSPPIKTNPGYIRHRVFLKPGDPLGGIYAPRLAQACPGSAPATNKAGAPITCFGPGQHPINLNGNGRAATDAELLAYLALPRDLKLGAVQNALRPLLADYDGNGILGEQLIGDIFPDWTGSFGTSISIARNWRVASNFEWRTGYLVHNLTNAFRGSQHATLGSNLKPYAEIEAILVNPASTAQERLVAADKYILEHRRLLEQGLSEFESGNFMRFREAALTYSAPESMAAKLRARSMSITFAARNLMLWTGYSGSDPEIAYNGREPGGGVTGNFNEASDSFGMPIPRRFSLYVNLGF